LTDFGLAKVLGRIATSGTASGAVMGTPAYMAPEQAAGATRHATIAADVYSLGAILYEMLTGHPPFRADTPLETLRQVVEEPPKPPTSLKSSLDRDLATICLKCLEKNPEHRYDSALAVAEDLERWLGGEPIQARSVRKLERVWRWCRREPVLASLMCGLFVLLTAVAVLGLSLYQRERVRVITAKRQRDEQRNLLLERIETERREPGRASVKISAKELAAVLGGKERTDGQEVSVILGLQLNLIQPDQFLSDWGPLIHYLYTNRVAADGPRLSVGLVIYASRSNAVEGMLKGEVDLMRADPAVYVLARQRAPSLSLLLQEVYGDDPAAADAAVFTRTNSGSDGFEDLRHRSFAFGEATSALTDFLPRAELVNRGFRRGDFLRVTNLHSDLVLAAVGSGDWDGGVTSLEHVGPLAAPGGEFKILAPLRSPGNAWLAMTSLDANVARTFANVLRALRDSNVMARLDPKGKLSGFRPAQPIDYDAVARAVETAELFDQPR
jgi:ABC-type phosphate/phosphonate transport system substrate-binding protein